MRLRSVMEMKARMVLDEEYEVPIEYMDSTGPHLRYEKAILIELHKFIATFRLQKNNQIMSFRYEDLYRHGPGKYMKLDPVPPWHMNVYASQIDAAKAAAWLEKGYTMREVSTWMRCSEVTLRKALRLRGLYKPLEPRKYKAWHKGVGSTGSTGSTRSSQKGQK